MKQQFKTHKFRPESLERIGQVNAILTEYADQGFSLTVRQLYYQLVARGLIPNHKQSYKRIVNLCTNAREAGLVDWYGIEDRARHIIYPPHWRDPAHAIGAMHRQFRLNRWEDQEHHIEIMLEKDALAGVLEGVCADLDVRLIPNRGYSSASTMYRHARRLRELSQYPKDVHLFYLGDFDPSGLDMDRDIIERLTTYSDWAEFDFKRLALTMEQIEEHQPPPDFTKPGDSRAAAFVQQYGDQQWELDALDPVTLANLVETEVLLWRDEDVHDATMATETEMKAFLKGTISDWKDKSGSIWPKCRGCGKDMVSNGEYQVNAWYEEDQTEVDGEWVESGKFHMEVYCGDCYEQQDAQVEPWTLGL